MEVVREAAGCSDREDTVRRAGGVGNWHQGRNQVRVQWHEQKWQMRSFLVCWKGSYLMLLPGGALPKLLSAPDRGKVHKKYFGFCKTLSCLPF